MKKKNTKTKTNVFHKFLSGICNPRKVVNHVVVAEPNAHMHNHYDHSSSFQPMETGSSIDTATIQDNNSSPPSLAAEHDRLGSPLLSSTSSPSSLQSKAVIPLVRRVSFQDQSCFNTSYRSTSDRTMMTMAMMNATTMHSQYDTIKITTNETASSHEVNKASRRLTMTNVLVMTVSLLLVLFIAAVIATTTTTTTTTTTGGFSALFLFMPTRVVPVLPSQISSSTMTTTAPSIQLPTTLTTTSTVLDIAKNNNSTSFGVDERLGKQPLPLDSIPIESVTPIVNGNDATMGMETDASNVTVVETRSLYDDDDDDDHHHDGIDGIEPAGESEMASETAKTVQPLHHYDEVVVNFDDIASISEQDKVNLIDDEEDDADVSEEGNDILTSKCMSEQGAEQEVDETREEEEQASSSLTLDTSKEDQEGESFTNPASTEHIDEDLGADDAFNKDCEVEEASDVVTGESHIVQESESRHEERVSDDEIKEEREIEGESVIISDELTAEQQVDGGQASDNEGADATLGEIESAAAADLELGKRGKARVGEKPDLQDWMLYSNVSMAVAFLIAIVASWVEKRKAPA
ncbi:hypothetical protein MHU86_5033 [Fragilaria crotonensis]|nr:hypothetical protein MHU86_5033 [Fragilaria crotonensis]